MEKKQERSCARQDQGPFLGPYYNTAPIIQGTQKGTIILTITHILHGLETSKDSLRSLMKPHQYALLIFSLNPPFPHSLQTPEPHNFRILLQNYLKS